MNQRILNRIILILFVTLPTFATSTLLCQSFYHSTRFSTQEVDLFQTAFRLYATYPREFAALAELAADPKSEASRLRMFKLSQNYSRALSSNRLLDESEREAIAMMNASRRGELEVYHKGFDVSPTKFPKAHLDDLNQFLTEQNLMAADGSIQTGLLNAIGASYQLVGEKGSNGGGDFNVVRYSNPFREHKEKYFTHLFPGAKLIESGTTLEFRMLSSLEKFEIMRQLRVSESSV